MIWFTSDWHIGSTEVLKSENRPFKNTKEMDNVILNNMYYSINKLDTLFIIGDIASGNKIEKAKQLLETLECNKILIKGNHDTRDLLKYFDAVYDLLRFKTKKGSYILCHYPLVTWENSDNVICLHGHSHGKLDNNNVLRYDVGVDNNNFKPVSEKEIIENFKGIKRPKRM